VPTPLIHERIPPAPVRERIIPTFKVGSLSTTSNVYEVLVIQESEVPNVVVVEEENQPHDLENDVPNQENLRRSQRVRNLPIPDDYEIYTSKKIHMKGHPTSYEEAMSSPHSSKWCETIEDEMRSMSAHQV
jgi:hypothetical protein